MEVPSTGRLIARRRSFSSVQEYLGSSLCPKPPENSTSKTMSPSYAYRAVMPERYSRGMTVILSSRNRSSL